MQLRRRTRVRVAAGSAPELRACVARTLGCLPPWPFPPSDRSCATDRGAGILEKACGRPSSAARRAVVRIPVWYRPDWGLYILSGLGKAEALMAAEPEPAP